MKLTQKDIKQFEKEFQIIIPEEYKFFLLKHKKESNLILVDEILIPAPPCYENSEHLQVCVEHFLPVCKMGESLNYDLEWYLKEYRDRLPEGFLPIATCGGCLYCIATSGSDKGKVYFWDSEFEDPDQVTYENTVIVADSFMEFLRLCKLEA